jgi:hypothetical protein
MILLIRLTLHFYRLFPEEFPGEPRRETGRILTYYSIFIVDENFRDRSIPS